MPEQNPTMFIPITKINAARREVWGWGAVEEPDYSDEILDYETSKPHVLAWSNRAEKRSGGASKGNVRSMHKDIAAGKLIDLRADDNKKGFFIGAKIVDENEWKKVEAGVYTGFSIGGNYANRWPDRNNPGKIRYTAVPSEISIVDAPCIPSATFTFVKAEGGEEERHFNPGGVHTLLKLDAPADDLGKMENVGSNEARDKFNQALCAAFPAEPTQDGGPVSYSGRYWIEDILDDALIVCSGRNYFRLPFTEMEGVISFGQPQPVERTISYMPAIPAMEDPPMEMEKGDNLEKAMPTTPAPVTTIPLEDAKNFKHEGQEFAIEKMPDPVAAMPITPGQEPSQDKLATQTAPTEDMQSMFKEWAGKFETRLNKLQAAIENMEVSTQAMEGEPKMVKVVNYPPTRMIKVK